MLCCLKDITEQPEDSWPTLLFNVTVLFDDVYAFLLSRSEARLIHCLWEALWWAADTRSQHPPGMISYKWVGRPSHRGVSARKRARQGQGDGAERDTNGVGNVWGWNRNHPASVD